MAATGKKGKKNKGKTLALTDFLANSKSSWSDEVDEAERLEFNHKPLLPAAPRAARAIDESLIPKNPPYTAYLSNLSFEVNEKDIADCIPDVDISNIQLPREEHSERIKGFGYVRFNDKLSFINALHMSEVTIKGRRVRIEIADPEGDRRRSGLRGNRDRESNYDSDRATSDWRTGPRSDYLSNERRGPTNRRDYSFRDRDNYRDGDRDRDRDRYRDGFDRGRNTYGERETNWRDSERRFSSDRDYGNRSSYGGRRNYDDRNGSYSELKTRPKLVLIPRRVPKEEEVVNEEPPANTATSIFGEAKPVDTASKERQIEERLQRERELTKNEIDIDRPKPRNDDHYEIRRSEPAAESKEKQWSRSSERSERDHSSSREINNGRISDSEDQPRNRESDHENSGGDQAREESGKEDYKRNDESENERSDGEDRYNRQNRSESRYNDKNRESDRSYRRDDKYRGDDRDRRDRDRRDNDRRDRGYDSEGRGRDSGGRYRDQERDRDGDRRYNDKDIDNRRYERDSDGKKYSSEREGDSRRYQDREGSRYKEQDDHGSRRSDNQRGSVSGDRGTRQGRGAPEKDRLPPMKDKPKESKKADEGPRMPKFKEAAAPNYIGTNKYCCLQEDGASE